MRKSLVVFLGAAFTATIACAAPITVPTGLNPGDQYRLAFVTSTTHDALSSNIADYNAFVTSVANSVPELVALGTTWKVIGSTSTIDARDNTGTNPFSSVGHPIYRLDGAPVASSNADLWDELTNPIELDENGVTAPAFAIVWTGTLDSGIASAQPLGVVSPGVTFGVCHAFDSGWVACGTAGPSSFPLNIYAMSGVLTVVLSLLR
jgi:hypothetical protein